MSLARSTSLLGWIFVVALVAVCFGPPRPGTALAQAADKNASDAQAADPAPECEKLFARVFESSPGPDDEREKSADATGGGSRGPGLRQSAVDALALPVPRTFDLAHVQPAHFAAALEKDPQRIFDFVRDQIAFEAYTGCLRGPRGTLLAMAGNSVDRAALLAELLRESGQKVRFARGTLPEADAKELVLSMWARPSRSAPPDRPRSESAKVDPEAIRARQTAVDVLEASVQRDYAAIRDRLKSSEQAISPQAVPSLDTLVKESQPHFWVLWSKDGKWVDLDPSFADALPGKTYAKAETVFDALPQELFHRVDIRIRLEEYPVLLQGSAEGRPTDREILRYTAKAADLSGIDVLLTHQQEKWKGPANSIKSALEAAIESTGQVKPVLVTPGQLVSGKPFRQKPPTARGIGGVGGLLRGEGTRKPVVLATAESIEFAFTAPDGHKDTVVREIFDLVGPARRAAGKNLSHDEVRQRAEAKTAFDVTAGAFDLFFTTGRIAAAHLLSAVRDAAGQPSRPANVRAILQRINVTFAAVSDALLAQVGKPDRAIVVFYADSPRVQIAEWSKRAETRRLCLDLRRDHARAVAAGPHPEDAFFAQVLRGVVDGTLERCVIDFVTPRGPESKWGPAVGTSLLFERARADDVSLLLLAGNAQGLSDQLPDDARARLQKDLAADYLALAPAKGILLGDTPRLAWWRIDPKSGETIAMMDDGLHPAGTELTLVNNSETAEVEAVEMEFVGGRLVTVDSRGFAAGSDALLDLIWQYVSRGLSVRSFVL